MTSRIYRGPVKNYTNQIQLITSKLSVFRFILYSLAIFLTIAILFSLVYYLPSKYLHVQVLSPEQDFWGSLYFSLGTQLSMNFGNVEPVSFAGLVALAQVMLGTLFFGIWISYIVLKALIPSQNTVVFSPHAFYIKPRGDFAILVNNTTSTQLYNFTAVAVVKYFRRNQASNETTLPYIDNSAILLTVSNLRIDKQDPKRYDPNEDGLKVSIRCSMSYAQFSTSVKYLFEDILVVDSTDFMDNPTFQQTELRAGKFWDHFENPISGVDTLHDLVTRSRVGRPSA